MHVVYPATETKETGAGDTHWFISVTGALFPAQHTEMGPSVTLVAGPSRSRAAPARDGAAHRCPNPKNLSVRAELPARSTHRVPLSPPPLGSGTRTGSDAIRSLRGRSHSAPGAHVPLPVTGAQHWAPLLTATLQYFRGDSTCSRGSTCPVQPSFCCPGSDPSPSRHYMLPT